ncbi:MAG: group II intron reverse transcriptase/maturase [Deltaproteobacteria bacterium]|nr:group II intron reverse transcriptase/maturase [Deltaproteobacteria bacterium]
MPTSLQGIAKRAKEQKKHRFQDLYRMLNEEFLLESWRDIRKDAACGVDQVSAEEYEQNLGEHIRDLVERLKRGRYRAKLVRRKYIPKGAGQLRPLGIPATEDKLLQVAVKRILEAIYEQDFLRCSYGYRPGIGALEAVGKLTVKLQFGRYNFVVEADIKSFFDNVDHEWMTRMLTERIDDGPFLKLITKWLQAGILEPDGEVIHPVTGTPQGGIVSPILANVYLHYVLDLWFQKVVKKYCRGEACLIRYADDFVCGFQYRKDAERFYSTLGKRLEKFGLKLSAEKTKVTEFCRTPKPDQTSFDFLGFEFRWGKDRNGKPHLKRRTSRKKLRKSLKNFTDWCKANRHQRLNVLFKKLNAKLRGYYNYYGVIGNSAGLLEFFKQALRILFKWLNRCSQRRSYTWGGFQELIEFFNIERPRVVERPKTSRAALTA